MRALLSVALATLLAATTALSRSSAVDSVGLARVPNGGVQPEVAIDASGVVHLVYLAGDPGSADVFYVRSSDGGQTFSRAVRVNSQPGSAIATGTIRGPQIAIGRNNRVHVAWNGSGKALPSPPANPTTKRAGAPMLYARSTAGATSFEDQRNLITQTTDLDGGGSIAADGNGRVFVAWHGGPADGRGGEVERRVWLARSTDDGATFDKERPVSDPSTGVCGCCALRLLLTRAGDLHLLYRSATDSIHRDVYSLVSRDAGRTFAGARVQAWEIGACPMTSMAFATADPVLRAWETDGQVFFNSAAASDPPRSPPLTTVGEPLRRKHPRLAVNQRGLVLLAWTEGTSWGRGGSLAWQVFGPDGLPTEVRGVQSGIPAWSFPSVIARPDGGFTILY